MRDIISNDTLTQIAKTVDEILDRMDSNTKRIEMPENIIDGDKVLFNYRQYDGVLYQVKVNDVNIIISDYTLDELLFDVHMRLKISKNKYVYVNIADKGFRMHGGSIEERTPTDYDVWIPDAYEFTNNGYAGRFTRDYYVPSEHTNIQYVQYLLVGLTVGEEYTFTFKSKIALHHSGTSVEWRDKPYGLLFAYDSTIDHEVVDVLPHDSGVWHSDVNFQSFYRDEQEHTYTCTITPEYSYMNITFIFDGVNSWDGYKSFTWSRFKSNKGINILDKEICFEGTWYSLGAGGGTSDLDAIELTYAEYQALTPAEKTDPDKIYFITDYPSGSGVVINPTGTATDTAETIEVDGTIYDFMDADAVHTADIGVAGGVAELDSNGKVPSAQLPTYPTVGNGTITIQKNGTAVDSFTTNQSSNKSVNITMAKGDVGLGNVDNTSDLNKPISTATAAAIAGSKTASGSVVTVNDAAPIYAEQVDVAVVATQSGSGTPSPSNVRPIQGYDIVSVDRCGKNLVDISTLVYGSISTTDGSNVYDGETSVQRINQYICVKPNVEYTISGLSNAIRIHYYRADKSYISGTSAIVNNGNTTIINGASFIRFNGNAGNFSNIFMIRLASDTDSTFAPFKGNDKVNIQLGNKNLLPMTVEGIKAANTRGTWSGNAYTYNGITFTINTDNDNNVISINVNGTSSSSNASYLYIINGAQFSITENMILNGCPSGGADNTFFIQATGSSSLDARTYGSDVAIPSGRIIGAVDIFVRSGVTISNKKFYPMLRSASVSDPTFSPYNPTLGGMVYGGNLTLNDDGSAVFVGDRACVDLGSMTYTLSQSYSGVFYATMPTYKMNGNMISSCYEFLGGTNEGTTSMANVSTGTFKVSNYSGNYQIYIKDTRYSDATSFKTGITGQQIVYELATPFTIHLSAKQLKLLQGTNNVWSNAGNVTLKYQPDNVIAEPKADVQRLRDDVDDRLVGNACRNLFNKYGKQTTTYGTATIDDDKITVTGTYYCQIDMWLPADIYTLSSTVKSYGATHGLRLMYEDNSISSMADSMTVNTNGKNVKAILLYCGTGTSATTVYERIQVERNDHQTAYEEYYPSNRELYNKTAELQKGINKCFDIPTYASAYVDLKPYTAQNMYKCPADGIVQISINQGETGFLGFAIYPGVVIKEVYGSADHVVRDYAIVKKGMSLYHRGSANGTLKYYYNNY